MSDKKSKSSAVYARRINMALQYIDNNIDQTIQLAKVAKVSHFSAYHFHRIFHALVGETVNEYVSRKRMEKAVCRLAYNNDMRITDIALAGGFSSSANFSKAFKLYFGLSPSELRNPKFYNHDTSENSKKGKLFRKYGKVFNPKDLYSQLLTHSRVFDPIQLEDMIMQVKIEILEENPIAYLSSPRGYELDSVYATWDKISQWAALQGVDEGSQKRFAICHDNPLITPEEKCQYDAAIVVTSDINITSPYKKSVIPSGKYVVAYYKDDAEKISNFMTELCSQWFPDSGYEPDDYPPLFRYLNDSRQDGYVEMNVYIKVKELVVS